METIRTACRRFLYRLKHDWFRFDNVLLTVCAVLCLAWTYGSIVSMSRNWELAQTLERKRRELAVLQLEVETLELENAYYASDEYAELSARAKLNKKLPGETLVYLPKNSSSAKNKHLSTLASAPVERSNLFEWLSFIFGIE